MGEKSEEKINNGTSQAERKSGILRVLEVDPETEKAILDFFAGNFSLKKRLPFEKEQSAELDQMISQISGHLKEFSTKYGARALDIPPENIHIFDEAKMTPEREEVISKKMGKVEAVFSFEDQQIFILHVPLWASNPLGLARLISHEMLHNISFQTAELKLDQDGKIKGIKVTGEGKEGNAQTLVILPRRMGFRVMKNKPNENKEDNEVVYFHFLDEAMIAELTMRFDWQYFPRIPLIAESKEYKTREEYYNSFNNQEVKNRARKKYAFAWDLENCQIDGENAISANVKTHEYARERERLNKLIDELFEKNEGTFKDREGVFDVFARAVMTGRLLPVARLIEKTFGKGSFRELGEKTAKKAS